MNRFQRNEMLFTPEGVRKLKDNNVTVFGVGGVGGYVCEMLGRSGIGHFVLVDKDQVDVTNINRQIIALSSTVGKDKVEVMKERLIEINPECEVTSVKAFLLPENKGDFDFEHNDFVVDAIDTVSAKIVIAEECTRLGVPLISSMGTGNKLHPEMLKITDISKTSYCPLARVLRRELRNRGIHHLPVLYSEEEPVKPAFTPEDSHKGSSTPASSPFVPSAAGILIASYVVARLLEQ